MKQKRQKQNALAHAEQEFVKACEDAGVRRFESPKVKRLAKRVMRLVMGRA